jgi:hypothetical protein
MSRTLSMNSGSRLSLKAWLRLGLERKGAPDAADAALAESGSLGQGAPGPVGGGVRLAFDRSRTVATGNPLWRHVLALPFTNFPRRHTSRGPAIEVV